jgi:hypothetical protein
MADVFLHIMGKVKKGMLLIELLKSLRLMFKRELS